MKPHELNIEQAFRQHYRQLCIYALHLVADESTAEDIVLDSFIALWEKGDGIQSLKPYLYAAVRNRCLNHLRGQGTKFSVMDPEGLSDEDLIERSELEARLWTAVDSLPERRRQVLLMSKRDGMKYEDIAYQLEISVNTVRNHISKALETLRQFPLKLISFALSFSG